MLLPSMYKIEDQQEIETFISRYSFATIVAEEAGELTAAHLPMLFSRHDGRGKLRGHLTQSNPVISGIRNGGTPLAIFQGPHGYISSSWYVDQKIPPTWNFTSVHIKGVAKILDSAVDKLKILKETVARYEGANGSGWSFNESDPNIRAMLPMITAFEMDFKLSDIQCCYKLSQNQKPADFGSAVSNLEAKGDAASIELADLMKNKALHGRN
jgi:transcriptional regulator